ncbi:hypothetical protein [Treponema zioleckii]|uniref:hypothetical protein n=1 Tax=Treponema zioleckii TaxID=331680 RepID=UPI00168B9442|nr:hypothetical protein [Treponema zioleckii]
MKKITKFSALAVLGAMFFAACSNITDGEVEGINASTAEEGTLSISITSSSNLIDFKNENSRTILPNAKKADDFDFYLAIQDAANPNSGYTSVKKVNVTQDETDSKKGVVSVTLSKANYNFKLYAVKKTDAATLGDETTDGEVSAIACLVGYASADLRYGESAAFHLRADGLTTKGGAELSLYQEGEWVALTDDYTINGKLVYLNTTSDGSITHNEGDTVETTSEDIEVANFSASDPSSANYTCSDIAPGTYNFVLSFTQVSDTSKVFEWSDTIVILPGETTTRTIGIPCVINTIPEAPTDFKVGYIDNSVVAKDVGYYDAEFVWTDASKNEKNFQIEWLKVPAGLAKADVITPTSDDEWKTLLEKSTAADSATETVVYGYDANGSGNAFVGDVDVYKSGSLGRNQQTATFKAAYGCRYIARIRSLNNVGESEWVYATVDENIEANAETGASAAKGFASKLINRYKIVYTLGKGQFVKDDGNGNDVKDTSIATVYFESEDSSYTPADTASETAESGKIAIMQPDGKTEFNSGYLVDGTYGSTTTPLLKNGSMPWQNWSLDGSTSYGSQFYGGSENLFLTAMYTLGTVEIIDFNDYIIELTADKTFTTSASADSTEMVGKSITYSVADLTADTNEWTLKSKKSNYKYDSVDFTIKSTKADAPSGETHNATTTDSGVTWTLPIPVKSLAPGLYQVTIRAHSAVKSDYAFTETVILNITD